MPRAGSTKIDLLTGKISLTDDASRSATAQQSDATSIRDFFKYLRLSAVLRRCQQLKLPGLNSVVSMWCIVCTFFFFSFMSFQRQA